MAIAKTKLITLSSGLENLDQVLTRFIHLENFHPVLANKIVDSVHGLTSFSADNACTGILSEIAQIEKEFDLHLNAHEICDLHYDFAAMEKTIHESHDLLKQEIQKVKDNQATIVKYQDAFTQLENIRRLDISLDDIFDCKYIVARVGRLPLDGVSELRYYRNRPFVFKSFSNDQSYSWCMYFTTPEYERDVDNVFSSLFFERIRIPDFVHGTPEKAEETLQAEIDALRKANEGILADLKTKTEDFGHRLSELKGQLIYLNQIFEAKKYVVGLGDKFTISGFAEISEVDNVQRQFDGVPNLEIQVRPPKSDKRITPPTKLKNRWFSRPFGMFVEMFGVPEYGGMDPTPFFAITYSLLFGIMFGDLGQGLVLIAVGLLLSKWKKVSLGDILVRVGIFSSIFGLLYGSFFGNETILTPFYTELLGLPEKPIHTMNPDFTMTLLIAAIAIGASLIVLSIIMGIVGNFQKKKYVEALCSSNGIAGLIFYGFILVAVALKFLGGANLLTWPFLIPFLFVPLVFIFLKEPLERKHRGEKMFPKGFFGFFFEGFFELFDVVLSYITNTMSFMRVGGFILSHAGMMLVFEILQEMVGGAGFLVAIVGNLFVIVLEGLTVGIQVLRLEFYEMFSRYYEPDGIAFQSLNGK